MPTETVCAYCGWRWGWHADWCPDHGKPVAVVDERSQYRARALALVRQLRRVRYREEWGDIPPEEAAIIQANHAAWEKVSDDPYAIIGMYRGDIAQMNSTITRQRSQIDTLRAALEAATAENEKWRHYKPDDATLAALKEQYGNGDGKAARLVYVRALEAALRVAHDL